MKKGTSPSVLFQDKSCRQLYIQFSVEVFLCLRSVWFSWDLLLTELCLPGSGGGGAQTVFWSVPWFYFFCYLVGLHFCTVALEIACCQSRQNYKYYCSLCNGNINPETLFNGPSKTFQYCRARDVIYKLVIGYCSNLETIHPTYIVRMVC